MDNLRLILILVGLVVLAAIWLLHRPDGPARKPGASRREERRREPFIGDDRDHQRDDETADHEQEAGRQPHQTTLPDLGSAERTQELTDIRPAQDAGDAGGAEKEDSPPGVPPEREWREAEPAAAAAKSRTTAGSPDAPTDAQMIVTLYVRARDERRISGLSLLDAAIKAGLRFGEMKIFHRRHRGAAKPVFSMANITRPGSFDPAGWNLFETPGVTLFMTLPGPVSALDAWDAMLATGQRLAELLDADLMDDAQCLLTRQRIAQIREEMREFDRRNGLQQ